MTFLETKLLVRELDGKKEEKVIIPIIETAWKNCTLEKPTGSRFFPAEAVAAPKRGEGQQPPVFQPDQGPTEKWRDACQREAAEIRLPPVY